MKILLVNKFLYPKGGAETYTEKLGTLLSQRGHEVEYFGMADERNTLHNRWGIYASPMDFSRGIRGNLTAPLRILYNFEARQKMRKLLEAFQPDIVHVNNIQYHLTPSILLAADCYRRETGHPVKLISTAHDYQLICPSHGLFDPRLQPCEKCLDGNYVHCLRTKCIKSSYLKSLLGMLDGWWWRRSRAYDCLDAILCCSDFLKEKLDTQLRFAGKTRRIRNFTDLKPRETVQKQGYVLQFGHLSREKGTCTLLEAARRMPERDFLFAGFGSAVEEICQVPNARYVGFLTGDALWDLVSNAALTVLPSEMYENCPFAVMESQILGTPVIGSRMGGIPELIREGETGELFPPGDAGVLEEKLRFLLENPQRLARYRENCRRAVFETPDSYYEKLMEIYTA